MNLVIVESSTKAKSISKYLNRSEKLKTFGKFEVIASQGHVRDLAKKNMGIDTETFECAFEEIPQKRRVIKMLADQIKHARTIYLASDNDREGEGIAWHIKDLFKIKHYYRIIFNEITEHATVNAVLNPLDLNMPRVYSYLSRRILDRLVGFKMTELLWKSFNSNVKLAAGRVQSATLDILCEREDEIRRFESTQYWSIHTRFRELHDLEFILHDLQHVHKINDASATQQLLKSVVMEDSVFTFHQLRVHDSKLTKPPYPFITSTLQQVSHSDLHFSIKKTMTLAQELYESGRITYMRTDSTHINADTEMKIQQYIMNEFGIAYVRKTPTKTKLVAKHAQEAHESIRPTDVHLRSLDKDKYSTDQIKLYDLIFKRTTAYYMSAAVYDEVKLSVTNNKLDALALIGRNDEISRFKFISKRKFLKFDGWLRLYDIPIDKPSVADFLKTYGFNEPVKLSISQLLATCTWTSPPTHFDEASLVKTLEAVGIGRPSTYATIIEKLFSKQYVCKGGQSGTQKQYTHFQVDFSKNNTIKSTSEVHTHGEESKNRIIVQEMGEVINEFVKHHFPFISSREFTAEMETDLDRICNGTLPYKSYLRTFYAGKFDPTYQTILKQLQQSSNPKHDVGKKEQREFHSPEIMDLIGPNQTCLVRMAKHGPVIEIKKKNLKSRFISLTSYFTQTHTTVETISSEEVALLVSMPVSITYKRRDFELCYGMHGFYLKGHRARLDTNHVKMIREGQYEQLMDSLMKI